MVETWCLVAGWGGGGSSISIKGVVNAVSETLGGVLHLACHLLQVLLHLLHVALKLTCEV